MIHDLNNAEQIVLYTSIVAGIDKHITADIRLGGILYTPPALKAVFENAIRAIQLAATLKEKYSDGVVKEHAAQAAAEPLALFLRDNLISENGDEAHELLGDFGMTVPEPKGAKTVAAKAKGIAARALTRQARHTMGRDQEQKVTGLVEVPYNEVPAPAATPATPATRQEVK